MNAQIRRTDLDMALSSAWDQLQVHHATHRNAAPFWSAYQAIQEALILAHPQHRVDLCNQLATFAERLGVVDHAQLVSRTRPEFFSDPGHAGSTSP
ncbi:hypothetical protein [Stenotrophomonas sp.]|uniref:hypothetical protein n=1 Tax=Stenotrophomonas sp. TaxID=69392 RepID=UPI002FC7E7F6